MWSTVQMTTWVVCAWLHKGQQHDGELGRV